MSGNHQSRLKGLLCITLGFLLLQSFTAGVPVSANAAEKGKIALVIGNEAYSFSPLRNPVNDARDMAETLEALGFEVIVFTDLKYKEMNKAVNIFGERLNSGAEVGLFYYAGHGMQISGNNYLIPVDANIRYEKEVRYRSIDAGYVLVEMENAKCLTNIVILDACRGNPFTRSFSSSSEGLSTMKTPVGTIIAYSTGPGKKAEDGGGENGVYTAALIEKMKTPGERIVDIFNSVRKMVRKQTGGLQVPWESTSLESPFYFLPPADVAAVEVPEISGDFTMAEIGNQGGPQPIRVDIPGNEPGDVWIEPLTGVELVWVPGGCYKMGCGSWAGDCQEDEKPEHDVCVDGFWMSKYEITNAQFLVFINDANDKGPVGENWFRTRSEDLVSRIQEADGVFFADPEDLNLPVTGVSWYGAYAFTQWLSQKTGKEIHMPTEAQWEYAAREGGKPIIYSGGNNSTLVAVTSGELSDGFLQPVGMKNPNVFGIYDMSGNVWEWCRDIYQPNAYLKHSRINPLMLLRRENSSEGTARVIRGGSHAYSESSARNTNRGSHWLAGLAGDLGFRIVMNPEPVMMSRDFTCMQDKRPGRNKMLRY